MRGIIKKVRLLDILEEVTYNDMLLGYKTNFGRIIEGTGIILNSYTLELLSGHIHKESGMIIFLTPEMLDMVQESLDSNISDILFLGAGELYILEIR